MIRWMTVLLCIASGSLGWADTLVLTNGDTLTGRIVKNDGKTVTFKPELLGETQSQVGPHPHAQIR